MYRGKLTTCEMHYKKGENGRPDKTRPSLHCVYQITQKVGKGGKAMKLEQQYGTLHDYVSFSSDSVWKLDQFLQAMGVATASRGRKGKFDPAKMVGKYVLINVKQDRSGEGDEYRARVRAVLRDARAKAQTEDEEEDEEYEDEEEGEVVDEEEEEVEGEEEDEDESYSEKDLATLTLADLKEIAEELEIDPLPRGRSKLTAAILEAQGGEEEAEEEEEEEEEPEPPKAKTVRRRKPF
jgi:hypothetical protein